MGGDWERGYGYGLGLGGFNPFASHISEATLGHAATHAWRIMVASLGSVGWCQ